MAKKEELSQVQIFTELWHASNKRSYLSREPLRHFYGSDLWYNCFAHVLAKGINRYPHFKCYAKNIIIISPLEHTLYDDGTNEKRIAYSKDIFEKTKGRETADWSKIYDLREQLIDEYNTYFPKDKYGIIGYKYSDEEVNEVIKRLNEEFFRSA